MPKYNVTLVLNSEYECTVEAENKLMKKAQLKAFCAELIDNFALKVSK